MSTSGARLQLVIAPAGAGKTTGMRALARAWRDSGGQVLGLGLTLRGERWVCGAGGILDADRQRVADEQELHGRLDSR